MTDPGIPPPVPKKRPWLQLAVVFPASFALAFGCCATGASLTSSRTGFLTTLGVALIYAGIFFLLVFFGSIVVGFFTLLDKIFSKGDS